jgi:hypothetical protein
MAEAFFLRQRRGGGATNGDAAAVWSGAWEPPMVPDASMASADYVTGATCVRVQTDEQLVD